MIFTSTITQALKERIGVGNRLSTIVTRTGDKGSTGMSDGSRRQKFDIRVHCLGEVDELNATIGVALSHIEEQRTREILLAVQHDLFDIGAELCQPGKQLIDKTYIDALESTAEKINEPLPPLKEFILPGGSPAVAYLQLTRTICRRAERSMHQLASEEALNPTTGQYINRLSDLIFILARHLAFAQGEGEVYWQSRYSRMNRDS